MKQAYLPKFSLDRQNLICIFLILIFWLLFYLPLFVHINYALADNDWYQTYYYADIFRKTILEYHQLPLWTPFMAGGYPFIGHPFDISLSPFAILILIFGAVAGSTIITLLLSLLGGLGMFYLTRNVLKYNHIGCLFSTVVYMMAKWGLNMIAEGNFQKLYYWLLPWLLAFFIRSKDNKRFIIFSGFILYMVLVQGGLILIPLILFLFLFACLQGIEIKKKWKLKVRHSYIIIFLLIIIFTLCLSAAKIVPMWQVIEMRVRHIHLPCEDSYRDVSYLTKTTQRSLDWAMLRQGLLGRNFYELKCAMYLGYIPLILCVLSFLIYFRQTWRYLFLLIVFTFIQMGSNAPIDIFKWIWHIHPLVHGIWNLNKYFTIFIFFLISLVGGRFFLIFEKIPHKFRSIKLIGFILLSFCACDMFMANRIYYDIPGEICYKKIPEFKPQHTFFQIRIKDSYKDKGLNIIEDIRSYRAMWYLLRQDVGLVNFNWEGNIRIDESAIPKYAVDTIRIHEQGVGDTAIPRYEVDKDIYKAIFEHNDNLLPKEYINPLYKGEVFFLNPKNKASLQHFSPNKIYINTELKSPDILVVNQNYHKSWRTNQGKIINYQGLLAVQIENKASYLVKLNYLPLDFYIGVAVSLITFAFAVGFLIFSKNTYVSQSTIKR